MNIPDKSLLRIAAFSLLCLLAPFSGGAPAADPVTAPVEAVPPRTVADIVKVLDHYKPDPAAAAKSREEAAAQPPPSTDRLTLLRFYVERARAAAKIGNTTQQIADLRTAREHMQRSESYSMFALQELASAESIGGNIVNASAMLDELLAQVPSNMGGFPIGTHSFAATIYASSGDFEAARKSLAASESTLRTMSNSPASQYQRYNWSSLVERARAEVFFSEGKFIEAEASFRKVLRERELDKPAQEIRLQRNMNTPTNENWIRFGEMQQRRLAQTLLQLGRLGEAELNIRASLKSSLERVGRNSVDTAVHLIGFAFILLEQGRFQDATLMAREALKSAEASGASPFARSAIFGRKALGAALVAEGKWDEALTTFDAMKAGVAGDPEIAKRSPTDDIDWATALLKKGRAEDARVMLARMLERSSKQLGERDSRTAQIRAFHAIAQAKLGKQAEALADFGKAVPILIEQARSDIAADTGGLRQVKRLTYIIESYLELMSAARKAGITTAGLDIVAESFRLADVARGSQVQRALAASAARASISDPALADLARREQDLQRRVNTLSELLKSLLSQPPEQQLPKIIADLRRDIDLYGKQRNELKRDIEKRFPDYAELTDPKPVTLAQAQAALRAGETLVSVYLGEDGSFIWAIPKTGEAGYAGVALTSAQVGKTVETLRRALDPAATSVDEIPAFNVELAARLYQDLFKPVEASWKGASHLLVVPHGALGALPLGLLPTATGPAPAKTAVPFEEYKQVPWLVRQVALTQLPSISALTTLRRTPAPTGERRLFLGIGDPLFSKEQAAEQAAPPAAQPVLVASAATATTTRGMPIRLRNAPKTSDVSSAELALLPRLPDTADELMEIAKTLGADPQQDLMLQKNANEKAVKSMNLANRRIISFATHGLIPGELNGLTQPALALTAPDVAGIDGDGLLTMDEILALKLNADWVVLSACNTASGEGAGAEAVSGLGRAFFYAGARALLVSNWPVDSIAARRLMTDLFKRYAAGAPTAKADSLKQAMIGLLDSPGFLDPANGKPAFSYAHPLFWAPFVLVGD
ncbi:MAG: CHAT domain-containing tetratricopeptide repeat protein [Betaproteobacteria bacterium]